MALQELLTRQAQNGLLLVLYCLFLCSYASVAGVYGTRSIMNQGEKEMADGNDLNKLLVQVTNDACYFMKDYPRAATRMLALVKYARALDKNQKSLIKLVLRLQRSNKLLNKINDRMFNLLHKGQKDILSVWLEEIINDPS